MPTTSEDFGFAFDSADLALMDDAASTETPRASGAAKRSATTETLAKEAAREMKDMKAILGKLETGTATRDEKARLKSLNAKMSRMKKEIVASATLDSVSELEALRSTSKAKAEELVKALKQKQAQSVIRAVCASEKVDLAFIIDCTSSMGPYIESVKTSIKSIVRQIGRTNGNLRLRLAVVAYRDISDGTQRFEVMDFVSSVEQFEAFVGSLRAIGGADTPEDMAGGIQKANSLSWSHPTRVAFLIADCPCHGSEFHSYKDSYPSGTPGISITSELQALLKRSGPNGTMSVYFGKITSYTDSMLVKLKSGYGIDLEVVSIDDVTKLATTVTSSVRRSIFKTMTLGGLGKKAAVSFAPPTDAHTLMATIAKGGASGMAQLKRFSLVSHAPSTSEWNKCPALLVKVYRNNKVTSMQQLRLPLSFGLLLVKKLTGRPLASKAPKTEQNTMFMRRATNPFAQGEIRIAFHGRLATNIVELSESKSSMVMKSFKHIGKGIHDREQYLKQMEVSNIAHFLAEEYNKSSEKPSHCAQVTFLPVCVVEEESSTRESLGERRFCVEPPLPSGKFEKYSNNTGYWDEDALDESLLRFSAWTYKATGGYLMITDLQGVKCSSKNKYYLTDPVILCKDIIRFGNTNLGEKFLKKCIDATHSYLAERGWS